MQSMSIAVQAHAAGSRKTVAKLALFAKLTSSGRATGCCCQQLAVALLRHL